MYMYIINVAFQSTFIDVCLEIENLSK